jgi:invasion protein IalB
MSSMLRILVVAIGSAALLGIPGLAAAQGASAQKPSQKTGQENFKTTQHKDWTVRCPKSGASGPCEMMQLVKDPDSGKPVMRVVMGYSQQNNKPVMAFILPLGMRLPPGVQLSVNGAKAKRFPYQICMKQGCQAVYPLENSLLHKLKHGRSAKVTVMGPRGKTIDLKFSLMGFTASNNAIAP